MPFYRFEIESPLQPAQVLERIEKMIRPARGWMERTPIDPARPFVGKLTGDGFLIYRDFRGRNSFRPQIRGRIQPGIPGSTVGITLYLHPFTMVFMGVWLTAVGIAAFSPGLAGETPIPALMFGAGILMILIGFVPQVFKARRLLIGALSGTAPLSQPG